MTRAETGNYLFILFGLRGCFMKVLVMKRIWKVWWLTGNFSFSIPQKQIGNWFNRYHGMSIVYKIKRTYHRTHLRTSTLFDNFRNTVDGQS